MDMTLEKSKPVMIECIEMRDDGSSYYAGRREATAEEIEDIRRDEESIMRDAELGVWPYTLMAKRIERERRGHSKKGFRAFLASLFA